MRLEGNLTDTAQAFTRASNMSRIVSIKIFLIGMIFSVYSIAQTSAVEIGNWHIEEAVDPFDDSIDISIINITPDTKLLVGCKVERPASNRSGHLSFSIDWKTRLVPETISAAWSRERRTFELLARIGSSEPVSRPGFRYLGSQFTILDDRNQIKDFVSLMVEGDDTQLALRAGKILLSDPTDITSNSAYATETMIVSLEGFAEAVARIREHCNI